RLVESLKSGKLPHLTWGRAILGGVVALSLLFGAAGGYVLLTGGAGLIGPTEAGAEASSASVAVLPFRTRGEGLELYGEGMVDLLTANLEGLGGVRTINAGTVVARWESEFGNTTTAELDDALRVAGSLNARYAIRGSVIDAGGQARLSAEVFDLADGSRVDGTQVEGPSDQMLELVDALTVQLVTTFVGTASSTMSRSPAVNTGSLDALEAYLRGEALYRELRFDDAIEAFAEATVADSLFALAWWSLSEAWGWVDPGSPVGLDALGRARGLSGDLPERERILLRVDAEMSLGSNAFIPALRSHLGRRPDDADAWNMLGELAAHAPWLSMSPKDEFEHAFVRATELMPSFSPYYIHLVGLMLADGREEEFQAYVAAAREINPEDDFLDTWQPAWDFHWGTLEEMAAAEAFFEAQPMTRRNSLALAQLASDQAVRALKALASFPLDAVEESFPFSPAAVSVHAGHDPEQWPWSPSVRAAGLQLWVFLTGDAEEAVTELSGRLAAGPSNEEAVSAALVAAFAGDDALRDRALDAIPDSTWPGAYGAFSGAATALEARRSAEAVSLLREGDAEAAAELLRRSLMEPSHDRALGHGSGLRGQGRHRSRPGELPGLPDHVAGGRPIPRSCRRGPRGSGALGWLTLTKALCLIPSSPSSSA
ncbi:MAG: hypothetical protein ACYTG4_16390, partial [Planctomycetota bacterium]